jgi:hypothetical protein
MKFLPALIKHILRSDDFWWTIIIFSKTGAGGWLMSTVVILYCIFSIQVNNCSAIQLYQGENSVTYQWENNGHFVSNQQAKVNFYSSSLLKQQFMGNHDTHPDSHPIFSIFFFFIITFWNQKVKIKGKSEYCWSNVDINIETE